MCCTRKRHKTAFRTGQATTRFLFAIGCFVLSEGLWATKRIDPNWRTWALLLCVLGILVGLIQRVFSDEELAA